VSSSEGNSPSLNDVHEIGPNILPAVLSTPISFCGNPVAVIVDVKQAFIQLSLGQRDRDLTRFFWYRITKDDKGNHYTTHDVVTYRFTRLPLGLPCSPFLLSATVRELATMRREEYPNAAPPLDSNIFMGFFVA